MQSDSEISGARHKRVKLLKTYVLFCLSKCWHIMDIKATIKMMILAWLRRFNHFFFRGGWIPNYLIALTQRRANVAFG